MGETLPVFDVVAVDVELEVDVVGADVGVKLTPVYTICKYRFETCP